MNGRLVLVAALAGLAACAENPGGPNAHLTVSIESADTLIAMGGRVQMHVVARNAAGQVVDSNYKARWSTSDFIIKVNGDGSIEGLAPGSATVEATVGSVLLKQAVLVRKALWFRMAEPQRSHRVLLAGGALQLGMVGVVDLPPDSRLGYLSGLPHGTFTSSNPAVLSVDSLGVLHARSVGRAIITGRVDNIPFTYDNKDSATFVVSGGSTLRLTWDATDTMHVRGLGLTGTATGGRDLGGVSAPVTLSLFLDGNDISHLKVSPYDGDQTDYGFKAPSWRYDYTMTLDEGTPHVLTLYARDEFGLADSLKKTIIVTLPHVRMSMTPIVVSTDDSTFAMDVNTSGEVVGYVRTGSRARAFSWQSGTATILPAPDTSIDYRAFAVNDRGDIAGGTVHALGPNAACKAPVVWFGSQAAILSTDCSVGSIDINSDRAVLANNTLFKPDGSQLKALFSAAVVNDRLQVGGTKANAGNTSAVLWNAAQSPSPTESAPCTCHQSERDNVLGITSDGSLLVDAYFPDRGGDGYFGPTQLYPLAGPQINPDPLVHMSANGTILQWNPTTHAIHIIRDNVVTTVDIADAGWDIKSVSRINDNRQILATALNRSTGKIAPVLLSPLP